MKSPIFYLSRFEKDQRTRIKIKVEDSTANAVLVTWYAPLDSRESVVWEIKCLCWRLNVREENIEFEKFVQACQKEEMRNYKIAYAEAANYKRNIQRLDRESSKKVGAYLIGRNGQMKKGNLNSCSQVERRSSNTTMLASLQNKNYQPIIPKEAILSKILQHRDHS